MVHTKGMDKELKIVAEPQMEPDKCKFILENLIVSEGSYRFEDPKRATGSILVESLFTVEGVKSLMVSGKTILVTKVGNDDWRVLGPKIGLAIRGAFSSGRPLIANELKNDMPDPEQLRTRVQKILNEEINPAVAAHGGYIELLDVRHNDIFIKMGGGCHGCGMATATLKQGVEQSLRQQIPELGAIYDTTDHASGMNPYYQPQA